ncbi:MAG: hypothetical protein N2247_11400 [Leptospiraceae bacterium]|jgi:nucleoside-diphosphate-sugar epimerase|nr:hypothetical protein [Leptospiraceae bacterium]
MSKLKILLCGLGYTSQYLYQNFEHEYKILSRDKNRTNFNVNESFYPDIVLDTIPPVYENHQIINPIYKEILLDLYNKKPYVYIHISSTSIYPEMDKEFDEKTPIEVKSISERGRKRWDLEERIISFFPYALILRSGGIYGPGRNLVLSLKNQEYNHLPQENKVVYRIHVYDLCQILLFFGQILLERGIEKSVFPGYKRNNLINAVYSQNDPIVDVLKFIKNQFSIEIPEKFLFLEKPKTNRVIKSLYNNINFRYMDYRKGFIGSMH